MFRYVLLSLMLVLIVPVQAEPIITHGLSFVGEVKYPPGFAHLDYANPRAPKGGKLVFSHTGSFDSLNPFLVKGVPAQGLHYTYDRLMSQTWDEPFSLYGLVAEKVEYPEDRSWVIFHLRKQARFHDGTPITAEDVEFSFKTIHGYKVNFKSVTKTEILDTHRIKFYFDDTRTRETLMVLAKLPVLSKAYFKTHDYEAVSLTPFLGSGPYKITEIIPGKKIVYTRVPDYWAKDLPQNVGHYNFDQVIYEYYQDDTINFEAFKKGLYDFKRETSAKRWMSEYNFMAVKKGTVKLEAFAEGIPSGMNAIVFNTRRPLFQDRQVRQALSLVFDFEWLNKNLFFSSYKRTHSVFDKSPMSSQLPLDQQETQILEAYQGQKGLFPEVLTQTFAYPQKSGDGFDRASMAKASQLLEAAGWVVKNGIRVHESTGQTFVFEIAVQNQTEEKIALYYAKNLRKLGITTRIRKLETQENQKRRETFDFDMIFHKWLVTLSPGFEQDVYWSSKAAKREGSRNYAGIENPVIDDLIKKLTDAKTFEEQELYARALDRVLMWGYYFIPLYHQERAWVAYNTRLGVPEYTPLWGYVIEAWWDNTAY